MPDIFVSSKTAPAMSSLKKETPVNGALSAFLFMPGDVRFETQEPGEEVILLLRRHWVTNVFWIMMSILFLITPIFLFPLVSLSGTVPRWVPNSLISLLIWGWYLLTFSYMLVKFLLWYINIFIVTSERIIDIDFINLLNKKFAATRIAKVEDVTMRTGGFIKAMFDYGDVLVQTASKEHQFGMNSVPHPDRVVRIINQLMGKEEHEHEA